MYKESIIWFVLSASKFINISHGYPHASRIMGGSNTTIDSYPSVVHVERFNGNVWGAQCGANILTPRWLLSAGHCFEEVDFTEYNRRIRAGSTFAGSGGTVINVESKINHPSYQGRPPEYVWDGVSLDGDLSLVYLSEALVYSDVIQPCSIPAQGLNIPDNATVLQVGWGRIVFNGELSLHLQEVETYTINRWECFNRYYGSNVTIYDSTVTENMICNGILDVGGQGPCNADSGGPMYYHGVVVGIVSWGFECGLPYWPAVSAKVSPYTNWILSTVG